MNFMLPMAYGLVSESDPQTYEEAVEESEQWREAIKKELEAYNKFQTWIIADPPENVKPIETKWVFHTKPDRTKKARLVAKGFQADRNNLWLVIWVDNILLMGEKVKIEQLSAKLTEEFYAKYLGELQCFIGIELMIAEDRIELSQHKLIDKMLKRLNLQECKGSRIPIEDRPGLSEADAMIDVPYCELVGSLTYLSQVSRPDVAFATSYLSRFLDCGIYVKSTSDNKLVYQKFPNECSQVITFADANWGNDKTDRKSVSGMASFHCGNLVFWSSKKQPIVALSSAEADVAASDLLYLKELLSKFVGKTRGVKCCLMVDNQGAIHMIKNYENTKRSKHIDIKFHFLKDIVDKQPIKVEYVESSKNVADIFKKPLSSTKFYMYREMLCLR
ncbi:hypothetical protein PR048_011753 [Dryococelus australis]|uniref:Reverse transcriptase Ty1/copia-type domain-containing protein n=1 Tax=Dryococelus australis TaxID=614101 RepID=A0ABQ9HME3_9NEOP|nr:hypothetical protein PR048_011753 [Dryococelus australis]